MTAEGCGESVGKDLKDSEENANGIWKKRDPYIVAPSLQDCGRL